MSSQPMAPAGYAQGGPATVARPGALLAATIVAAVAGLAMLVNGVLMAFTAENLYASMAADELGMSVDEISKMIEQGYDETSVIANGIDVLTTRGYVALVVGGLLVAFALLMTRGAKTWTRVMTTICVVLTLGMSAIVGADTTTGLMMTLVLASVLGGLVGIVLTWLPAISRYAKAPKAS